METTDYRGFEIRKFKPGRKTCYRIYRDGVFKQTSSSTINAKRLVDFCVDAGVWK
jgi:hypothetical protein